LSDLYKVQLQEKLIIGSSDVNQWTRCRVTHTWAAFKAVDSVEGRNWRHQTTALRKAIIAGWAKISKASGLRCRPYLLIVTTESEAMAPTCRPI